MPADLTQETIDVVIGEETFIFKIPTPRDYARMGARAAAIRRVDAPETMGAEYGLDNQSFGLYRAFALFEILLVRADAKDNWPFSDNDGKPVVDSAKFPPASMLILSDIYEGFEVALRNFLKPRVRDDVKSGEEALGDQPAS